MNAAAQKGNYILMLNFTQPINLILQFQLINWKLILYHKEKQTNQKP